jgi:hypothetical protein
MQGLANGNARAWVFAIATTLPACSSLSGLSGGRMSDAGPADGPAAGPDGSPCLQMHTFCDDFDHGSFGDPWTTLTASSPGSFGVATDHFVSPPNSAAAAIPAMNPSQETLEKDLVGPAATLSCAFDVFFDQSDTVSKLQIVSLAVTLPASAAYSEYSVLLAAGVGQSTLTEGGEPADGGAYFEQDHDFGGVPTRTWFHVSLGMDFGTPSKVTLAFNGSTVLSTQLATSLSTNSSQGLTIGALGIYQPQAPWRVLFDDVFCDVH